MSVTIECERSGFTADRDLYMFRIMEPHITGNFVTLVHMRIDDQWQLVR